MALSVMGIILIIVSVVQLYIAYKRERDGRRRQ